MGSKCGYDKRNNHVSDVYYRYAQLAANNTDRKMDFYNKEIYMNLTIIGRPTQRPAYSRWFTPNLSIAFDIIIIPYI